MSAMTAVRLSHKGILAVVIGNWLEFYDFLAFTFFAVMIGDAFFPGATAITRLLAALATFGAGFVTRPIGAALIGAYADRAGRRAALTLTLVLMAVGSGLVALTPSYATIGIAAPTLLVIARLIQGFSCGGEVGPATTYLLECAPLEKRAAITAWQGYSQQLAIFLGSLIGVILATTLSKAQLYAWGWRVPFLLGIFIAPVGLYIRRQLPETLEPAATQRSSGVVLGQLFRHHSRPVIFGVLIICGGTISTYVFNYMNTYAIATLKLSATVGTTLTLTGSLASIAGMVVGAWADRFGRKRMLAAERLLFVVSIYPAYLLLTSAKATPIVLIVVNMVCNFLFAISIGSIYAFLAEAFPRSVRSSGLAVLYAVSVAIFGGTTQFVVAWLIHWTENPMMPAWYQIAANLVSVVGILGLMRHPDVAREAV
jgi:MFS family permease